VVFVFFGSNVFVFFGSDVEVVKKPVPLFFPVPLFGVFVTSILQAHKFDFTGTVISNMATLLM
jgi:hypothetical protein